MRSFQDHTHSLLLLLFILNYRLDIDGINKNSKFEHNNVNVFIILINCAELFIL